MLLKTVNLIITSMHVGLGWKVSNSLWSISCILNIPEDIVRYCNT